MGAIENGKLRGARWVKANSSGGAMTPRYLVVHDTAGALRPFSSVEWFASKECKTSAHFVVERDGTITQMVPTNRKAFHAGVSSWKGTTYLNSCSIGIEIVNPGKLDEKGKADFGKIVAKPSEIVHKATSNHGNGYWLPYTPEQIEAVKSICRAAVEEYPDCNEILTHWEIAPKRKIDTNPLFPLAELRKSIFDPTPGEVERLPPPEPPSVPLAAPTIVGEAMKSKTFKLGLGSLVTWIATQIEAAVTWVVDRVDAVINLIAAIHGDVEGGLAPFKALAGLVKANVPGILATIAFVLALAALAKHLIDRKQLTILKQKVGEDHA